jgi:hypothetical protein
MGNRKTHRGSTLLEFTLIGIPLVFVLISIFEIARGMWVYTTLAHAVKEGNRYVIVHANNCGNPPNSCWQFGRIRHAATVIRDAGVGLIPTDLQNVQFISSTRTVTCPTLQACINAGALGDTFFPSAGPAGPGVTQDVGGNTGAIVEVRGLYPFRSAIALFWPGAGPGMNFGTFLLPASSRERIQY